VFHFAAAKIVQQRPPLCKLLEIVGDAREPIAVFVIEVLAPYKHNAKLMQRLTSALTVRGDEALLEQLAALTR